VVGGDADCRASSSGTSGGSCGSTTYAGYCAADGSSVTYCNGTSLSTITCDSGYACSVVGGDADCRASSSSGSSGSCGSVTYAGNCSADGSSVTYCNGTSLSSITCDPGYACTVVGGDADCRADSSGGGGTGDCGSVTYSGMCDGDTLTYCNNGTLTYVDCTAFSESCTVVGGDADCR
jgi:hypothetical protein